MDLRIRRNKKIKRITGGAMVCAIIFLLAKGFLFLTESNVQRKEISDLYESLNNLNMGDLKNLKTQLDTVLERCNYLLTIDASNEHLYLIKARILYYTYQYSNVYKNRELLEDKVLECYRKVLAINPSLLNGEDYVKISFLYYEKGPTYYDLVVKYGKLAMDKRRDTANLWKIFAYSLVYLKEYKTAFEIFDTKLEQLSDEEIAFYKAICLKNLNRFEEAEQLFQKVIAISLNRDLVQNSYNNIAWMAYNKGQFAMSLQLYQSALTQAKAYSAQKDISEIYYWLSKVYFKMENWTMGNYYRRLARKVDPSNRFLQEQRKAARIIENKQKRLLIYQGNGDA